MALHYCYTALLAALMITVTSCNPPRDSRRAPGTNVDRPITLEELEDTCSVQGWTQCLHMVRSLLNTTHPINVGYAACLRRNSPYSSSDTSPAPVTYSNAGNSTNNATESGSAELPTTTNTSSTSEAGGAAREQQRCTVSGEQKKRIRSEVYCKQLFDIDEMLHSLISYMCLLRDTHCVQYFPDPGYLTPHQIMDSIRLWHESVIDTHRKCCESQDQSRIFTRDLDELYGNRVDFLIGDLLGTCFIQGANNEWDIGLKTVALMVHIVELMQDLGRRRTCLRGCFSEGQVQCTNLVPP